MRDLHIEFATGLWSKTVDKSWGLLEDDDYIRQLGFRSASEAPTLATHDEHAAVAATAYSALLSLSKNFCVWELEHTHGLPFYFAALLSKDPAVVTDVSWNIKQQNFQKL
jgi:hypothetical protein